ncbi:MAG TPA: acetyl-CoA carboxylase biotin carboxyl carrier protein subunit [Gammaproteobacteria bacterium]|nr:acetyl-CoA carboxylase biotin carboxyl carrier protein subunit [Gammaproteobacteria bacterium]|tara:strand:- start:6069 stop:6293 length:225 start_codon:yes stop_codon:yes gene_type:complete
MARLTVESEVTGNVWKVMVAEDTQVSSGEVLMILESMKMEIPVEAPTDGTVVEILVAEEEQVEEDQALVIMEGK